MNASDYRELHPTCRRGGTAQSAFASEPLAVPDSTGTKCGYNGKKNVGENGWFSLVVAGIAQLVEQLICNQQVVGSKPTAGSPLHEGCHRNEPAPAVSLRVCGVRLGFPFEQPLRSARRDGEVRTASVIERLIS